MRTAKTLFSMLRNRTPWNQLKKGVKGSTGRCRQGFQSRALKTPGDGTGCTYFCYGAALKAGSSTTLSSPSWLVECYLTPYEPHPSLPSSTACPRHLFYVPSCRYSDMEYDSRSNDQCPCRCWSACPLQSLGDSPWRLMRHTRNARSHVAAIFLNARRL